MHLHLVLDMAADGFGDRIVVGRRSGGMTAVSLRVKAAAAAAAIRDSEADAVLYLGANGPAFPVALFGAGLAGVPLVPLNYRLGRAQLDALLANHQKAYGIADQGTAAVALADNSIESRTPAEFLESLTDRNVDLTAEETDAPAVIIYTSGTTSAPKGVFLRHENLASYVLGTVEFASAEETDAALVSVPPYHIAAIANVLSNLYAGRRIVALDRFAADDWLATVEAEGITNAMVVPTMLSRILDAAGQQNVSSLRSLAYGGAPMPTKVVKRALSTWPHVGFVNAYGLTETSSTIAVLSPQDHRDAFGSSESHVRARLGSVGKVLPTVEVQVRDSDGQVLPAGSVGRIFVKGEQVSAEYAGAGKCLDAAGFFDTRDDGWLDGAGYLFVSGRSDDTIIRGAENIAPAEIEEVMLAHPAVADVVVLGMPHEEWGHSITAAVVPAHGTSVTADELKRHVKAKLRSSKTPDQIVFWDELPRTETGKIMRRDALSRLLLNRSVTA